MHEMSLVHDILDYVLETCEGKGVTEVNVVRLTIGDVHDVVDSLVPGLFRFLARGTIAADAEVVITRVPMRMRCRSCEELFEVDLHALNAREAASISCPKCGAVRNYHMVSGTEFRIDSIEVTQRIGA